MRVSFVSIYCWAHFLAGAKTATQLGPIRLQPAPAATPALFPPAPNCHTVWTNQIAVLVLCRCRLQSDWSTRCGSFGAGGKMGSKVDTHKRYCHFWKKQTQLAELYSVAALNGHVPVAEHSQWRRFWRLKELLEKTQLLCYAVLWHREPYQVTQSSEQDGVYHGQPHSYSWPVSLCTPRPSCRQTVETMSLSHGHYSLQSW